MNKLCFALLAAVATTAAIAPAAQAQSAGDVVMRLRAVNLDPANKDSVVLGGTDVAVTINSKVIPEIDFTYYLTPNFAAELVLTYPQKQDVSVDGAQVGTLKHLPPTLSAQYHFTHLGPFKPYLGAGVNYTRFSSVHLPTGLDVEKDSVGLSLQAGVDYAIDSKWSLNFDIKKVQIRTDLLSGGVSQGTIKIDPTLVGVGVGYKF